MNTHRQRANGPSATLSAQRVSTSAALNRELSDATSFERPYLKYRFRGQPLYLWNYFRHAKCSVGSGAM